MYFLFLHYLTLNFFFYMKVVLLRRFIRKGLSFLVISNLTICFTAALFHLYFFFLVQTNFFLHVLMWKFWFVESFIWKCCFWAVKIKLLSVCLCFSAGVLWRFHRCESSPVFSQPAGSFPGKKDGSSYILYK